MTLAASGEFNLFVLVVMAVIAVVNWIARKANAPENKPPPGSFSQGGSRPAPAESEEERMRRFLEALGIPADSSTATRQPPPVAPAPVPAPAPHPARRKAPPPPLPVPSRRPVAIEEASAPRLPVEKIELAELSVPVVAEFETISSRVAAVPKERPAIEQSLAAGAPLRDLIRSEFASPQRLRAAFVLREILGPPRGLQS